MSSAGLKLRSGPGGKPAIRFPGAGFSQGTDDGALIRRAQAGHWQSFVELASNYDGAILAFALRLTGSQREACRLFQTAFAKAFRELRSYRFQCSFYLWLYRIVAGCCLAYLEDNRAGIAHGNGLETGIHRLSPHERIVLELKHYFGLRLETIAAILETSEESARNTFVRAIAMLRLHA